MKNNLELVKLTKEEKELIYFQLNERKRQFENILATLNVIEDRKRIKDIYETMNNIDNIMYKML